MLLELINNKFALDEFCLLLIRTYISANTTKKTTEAQLVCLTNASTDPNVLISGLHFGPKQLRISVHGAQRRP